jgi:hypothetical protein
MRQAQELLSLSAFQAELGKIGNERHPKALKDLSDIARLPSSQATLPSGKWAPGNVETKLVFSGALSILAVRSVYPNRTGSNCHIMLLQ